MRSIRLEPGCRIGMKILGLVHPKPIASARADVGHAGKIPVFLGLQRMKCSLRVFRRAFFQNKIQLLSFRRPNTKMSFVFTNQFRANRIAAFCERHHVRLRLSNPPEASNVSFRVQHRSLTTCGRWLSKQPSNRRETVPRSGGGYTALGPARPPIGRTRPVASFRG